MNKDILSKNANIVYFSHGGGPLPLLNEPSHAKMNEFMKNLPCRIQKPDSVVVFSAHWEETVITVQSGSNPDIMYDYYGFPEEAYKIEYPCKGDINLAMKIAELFEYNGIQNRLDNERAYDHGSYIPMKMMYPNADIPVVQISLHQNLDPLTHLKAGKALRPLLRDNLLIIGSGFSFHNMRKFDFEGKNIEDELNNGFQDNLIDICSNMDDEENKWKLLIDWEKMPGARYCHPREEHLLPLFVCAGLAEKSGTLIFDDYILGKRATAFLW